MNSPVKPTQPSKSRGRPRSERARVAILDAARQLLQQGGPAAITMEAVAALAGVGKPTVYRWWPDRHAVAMAALMDAAPLAAASTAPRAALGALRQQLQTIASRFASNTGRHVTSMLAASEADSELSKAFRNHFVLARRSEGKVLLQRAIEQKELRADLDLEVALDLLYGPLFFRLLLGHAPLDRAFIDLSVDHALRGLSAVAAPRRGASRPRPKPKRKR